MNIEFDKLARRFEEEAEVITSYLIDMAIDSIGDEDIEDESDDMSNEEGCDNCEGDDCDCMEDADGVKLESSDDSASDEDVEGEEEPVDGVEVGSLEENPEPEGVELSQEDLEELIGLGSLEDGIVFPFMQIGDYEFSLKPLFQNKFGFIVANSSIVVEDTDEEDDGDAGDEEGGEDETVMALESMVVSGPGIVGFLSELRERIPHFEDLFIESASNFFANIDQESRIMFGRQTEFE